MGDVTDRLRSPIERERDAVVARALNEHGGRLRDLAVVVTEKGGRWKAEVLSRDALLERIDTNARWPGAGEDAPKLKDMAAWIRGSVECPEIIVWADGTTYRAHILPAEKQS